MELEKEERKIAEYTVLHTFPIGTTEIAIGENKYAPQGERYLLTNINVRGILECYDNSVVSDDYLELVAEYSSRISEQVKEVTKEYENISFDVTPLSIRDCKPVKYTQCIKDKVVVLKEEVFKPEYANATRQIQLCVGGFGAAANARGTSCYCINLITGKENRFERQDVLGVIEKDNLPEWAKKGLEKVEEQRAVKNKNGRSER